MAVSRDTFLNGLINEYTIHDFSTWDGFGKLWEWAKEQEWWIDFVDSYDEDKYEFELVNPDYFADSLFDFLTDLDED